MYDFKKENLLKYNNLRNLISLKGITQEKLAEDLGDKITVKTISRWMNKKSLPKNGDIISRLTQVLDTDQRTLFFHDLDEINDFEHDILLNSIDTFFKQPTSNFYTFEDTLTSISNSTSKNLQAIADLINKLVHFSKYFSPDILICFTRLKLAENQDNEPECIRLNQELRNLLINFCKRIIIRLDDLDGLKKELTNEEIGNLARYKIYNLFSLNSPENLETIALNNMRLLVFSLNKAFFIERGNNQVINNQIMAAEFIKFALNESNPDQHIKELAVNAIHLLKLNRKETFIRLLSNVLTRNMYNITNVVAFMLGESVNSPIIQKILNGKLNLSLNLTVYK